MFPKAASVFVYDIDDDSIVIKLRLQIVDDRLEGAEWAGAPVLVGVSIGPNGNPREITATEFHKLPIEKLVTSAVRAVAMGFAHPLAPLGADAATAGAAATRARRRRSMTSNLLADVARVVTQNPDAPTQAVADELYCSYRTAGRWVAAARSAGVLPKLSRKSARADKEGS
jgi:hypothetical protein